MTVSFIFPPTGFGPGSQPAEEDQGGLNYVPMPSGMRTFEAHVPYLENAGEAFGTAEFLLRLSQAASKWRGDAGPSIFDLTSLDVHNRAILNETLGEGEVSVVVEGAERLTAQESVFAGIWRIASQGNEHIEIGAFPVLMPKANYPSLPVPEMPGAGVVNAPAILTEILDHAGAGKIGGVKHVINLTLLPHTLEDLVYLDHVLGSGGVTILSRGYGNCRVERTAYPNIWRVRYFNSQDALVLDTIEVTDIPEIVLAAPEDIADSAERLAEVAGVLS